MIDGQEAGRPASTVSDTQIDQRLQGLLAQTHAVYAGLPVSDPAFAAFKDVVKRHNLRQDYALDHLAGFAMDVQQRDYRCLQDTLEYCYHVAGVVGLMMGQVMGVRDDQTLDRACDLGMAFQLTNIARDIVEDAGIGRCYLPADWLDEMAIPADRLTDPAAGGAGRAPGRPGRTLLCQRRGRHRGAAVALGLGGCDCQCGVPRDWRQGSQGGRVSVGCTSVDVETG